MLMESFMKSSNTRALVVGGAGFIGSILCSKLLECTDRVICVDNLMRGKVSNIEKLMSNDKFVFIKEDANNQKEIINIIKKYDINYIFHLAANSDIQASAYNPSIEFESTASTTWNLLAAMRETEVKKLFFASTSAVYGELNGRSNFKEDDSLNPISYYGSAKMASEAFIKSFSYMNDFDSLIYRFPNVIGPNLTHGVIFDFINRLRDNPNELVVLGNGTQCKPYMHVYDLIAAILHLCWDNKGVNIYNIGVDSATRVSAIVEMVVKEMKLTNCKILYGKEGIGWKGDVATFAYSLDKIFATGWRPSLSSDEAVRVTIEEALK